MMTQADRVASFIETFLTLGGSFEGEPFELLPFQREVIEDLYATNAQGDRLRRRYLLGLPRKNGKSQLGAALALYHLVADRSDPRPLVISAAGDRQQARLVFEEAARMVRQSEDLRGVLEVFRNEIRNPSNGGTYKAVSADAGLQQGLNPSMVVFDELHVFKNADLLDALTMGSAMRRSPLFVIITTAGFDLDAPLGRLYSYGLRVNGHRLNGEPRQGELEDDAFGMSWYGPEPGETFEHTDTSRWPDWNPAWSIMPDPEGILSSALRTTSESSFIRFHLNGWTTTETAWLPAGSWEKLAQPERSLAPGEEVVLGFDGAWRGDCTALVACSTRDFHLERLAVWEAPPSDPTWRVPVFEVEQAIRDAFEHFRVRELVADPYRWEQTLQGLASEGLPVVEYPTNAVARIVPACQSFYEAVMDGTLSHDGDPALARHLANAQVKEDARGTRITKEHPGSRRHIDLAVAAVIAHYRARLLATEPVEEKRTPRLVVL